MKQFTNLIQNYSCIKSGGDDCEEKSDLFLNLEVIANDHLLKTSPWRSHSIKKAFEIAKETLFHRMRSQNEIMSNCENQTKSEIKQQDHIIGNTLNMHI